MRARLSLLAVPVLLAGCVADHAALDGARTIPADAASDVAPDAVAGGAAVDGAADTADVAPADGAAVDTCPADCPAPTDPCLARTCPAGACVVFYRDEAPCDDGDPCTQADHCVPPAGGCWGTPITCDDHDPCTADRCEAGACTATPGPCSDPAGDPDRCGALAVTCPGGTCDGGHCTRCAHVFTTAQTFTDRVDLSCPDMPAGSRLCATLDGAVKLPPGRVIVRVEAHAIHDGLVGCSTDDCDRLGAVGCERSGGCPCGVPAGCAAVLDGDATVGVSLAFELFAPYAGELFAAHAALVHDESGAHPSFAFEAGTTLALRVLTEGPCAGAPLPAPPPPRSAP